MKLLTWTIGLIVLLITWYIIWSATGKDYSDLQQHPQASIGVIQQGENKGKGNILGLQPYFTAVDYCDEQHFTDRLRPYFQKARSEGLLQPNSIVVLPENTGTWLAFSGEKASVYQSDSLIHGIAVIVNSNLFTYIPKLFVTKKEDLVRYALFVMKSRSMANSYQRVFSSLAREFSVTIVAGSIVLPGPSVDKNGNIKMKKGDLYNASFVFGADGKILQQPVKKMTLREDEKKFISAGKNQDLQPFETPSGRLAVLVGADSRYPAVYDQLQSGIVAVPAFSEGDSTQAWMKNSFMQKNRKTRHDGLTVFTSGKLWEMQLHGKALTLHADSVSTLEGTGTQGRIVNVWLQ